MKVMKFGGSSVKDAEKIRTVAEIIREHQKEGRVLVVLSAMRGVTDVLISAAREAEAGDRRYRQKIEDIRVRQDEAVARLLPGEAGTAVAKLLHDLLDELDSILHGVELVRECSPRTLDYVQGFGELLNCHLFTAYLDGTGTPAAMLDARRLIVTDDSHGNAEVDFAASYERVRAAVEATDRTPVITGFIAATAEGVTTTLGRNGSDYTASIIGAGASADLIEIWTDVDGVYSADPRFVSESFVVPEISYAEAMELSYFGAKVIHPFTMIPAVEKDIPLVIKNTLNPSAPGTRIVRTATRLPLAITGIASVGNVALINVEGGGMVGIPGIASRVFGALARARVNIIMISQASSEHSICMVFPDLHAKDATEALRRELGPELHARKIQQFNLRRDLEIVAVIGEDMRGRPGISGRLFGALGEAAINVLAIAQGSSEMNISFVVDRSDRDRVLNVVHQAFFPEGDPFKRKE
ncbi:aspartate kinase [Salinispira pacifica]